MASTVANAFDLLGNEKDNEASTIVAVKTAEAEEHKKIVAQQKKIAAEHKKEKIAAEKKKAEAQNNKKITSGHGNAGQRYINNGHHQRNGQPTMVLSEEESYMRWLAGRERWLAGRERWLAREAEREAKREQWLAREEERKKDRALKTLKEYEEHKALEKQHKAEKSILSVPESTPLREAATLQDDFQTKQKSKNGPARGRGTQDSRKNININNGNNYKAGYSKRNQDNPDKTVIVKPEPAAAPDLSETNFPVLGSQQKSSVKHGRKDNTH